MKTWKWSANRQISENLKIITFVTLSWILYCSKRNYSRNSDKKFWYFELKMKISDTHWIYGSGETLKEAFKELRSGKEF